MSDTSRSRPSKNGSTATASPIGPIHIPPFERVFGAVGSAVSLGGEQYHFARFTAAGVRVLQAYLSGETTQLLIAPLDSEASVGDMIAEAAVLDIPDTDLMAHALATPTAEQAAVLTALGIDTQTAEHEPVPLITIVGAVALALSQLDEAERRTHGATLFGDVTLTAAPRLLAFFRRVLLEELPDDLIDRCEPEEISTAIDAFFHLSGFRLYEAALKNSLGRRRAAMQRALATMAGSTNAPTTPDSSSTSSTRSSSP